MAQTDDINFKLALKMTMLSKSADSIKDIQTETLKKVHAAKEYLRNLRLEVMEGMPPSEQQLKDAEAKLDETKKNFDEDNIEVARIIVEVDSLQKLFNELVDKNLSNNARENHNSEGLENGKSIDKARRFKM